MTSARLSHPSELTAAQHAILLGELQTACGRYNANCKPVRTLHVRDFWFLVEDGKSVLDLFVEPTPSSTRTSPFPTAEEAVTLDECLPLHHFLLEDGCLDAFDDEVSVRVGSLGMEPPLRTLEHFLVARGQLLTLKTWTKRQGRDRFTLFLDDVLTEGTSPSLRLKDGTESIEVPLETVKFAQALLEQPKSAKANAHKAPKKAQRARGKA